MNDIYQGAEHRTMSLSAVPGNSNAKCKMRNVRRDIVLLEKGNVRCETLSANCEVQGTREPISQFAFYILHFPCDLRGT